MKKVAVLLSQGFEECEALTTVDVLRRAGLTCDMVGVEAIETTGSHGISVLADRTLTEDMDDYDMVVLPGGLPGAEHLRDDARVIALLRCFDAQGKFIAAICAAPMALKAAGVTDGRAFTSYPVSYTHLDVYKRQALAGESFPRPYHPFTNRHAPEASSTKYCQSCGF